MAKIRTRKESPDRTNMSRDMAEIKEIRKEKANVETLIKNYQKRNEELKAKEAMLMRKIGISDSTPFGLSESENAQKSDGYIICDPTFETPRRVESAETRREKIMKLREEVLQKQFENMKLEKELQLRKEEHRRFHEILSQRKAALGQPLQAGCFDYGRKEERDPDKFKSDSVDKNSDDEMDVWEEMGGTFDR